MYGFIWNAKGVGEPEKGFFIHDMIVKFDAEFADIQETKRSSFTDDWLRSVTGRFPFSWICVPAKGHSGGILLGVNCDFYDVLESEIGRFHARTLVKVKTQVCVII